MNAPVQLPCTVSKTVFWVKGIVIVRILLRDSSGMRPIAEECADIMVTDKLISDTTQAHCFRSYCMLGLASCFLIFENIAVFRALLIFVPKLVV
jgi:hypothetical protein